MRDADTPTPTQSPMPATPTRPQDEIARLGDEVYLRDIRPQVEADHHGEYVAIDVASRELGHLRRPSCGSEASAGAVPGRY